MINTQLVRRALLALTGVLILVGACSKVPDATLASDPSEAATIIYLVRHAEKVKDGSRDPLLSPAGVVRAQVLANRLAAEGVTAIHSTNYIRTRDTVTPLATRLGLEVQLYNPGGLSDFAQTLRMAGGRQLVSGHSNTTPVLVELLGGAAGDPIEEAGEYDRLYVITIAADGTTRSEIQRYGAPWVPQAE